MRMADSAISILPTMRLAPAHPKNPLLPPTLSPTSPVQLIVSHVSLALSRFLFPSGVQGIPTRGMAIKGILQVCPFPSPPALFYFKGNRSYTGLPS